MMVLIQAVWHALQVAFLMLWEILWPLALGVVRSAIVKDPA